MGVTVLRFTVFLGEIYRGHIFFANQSWDVVFFCWMNVDEKGSCLVFFVENIYIYQNHRIHVGCKACNVWMYWISKDGQAKNRSVQLQVLLEDM